MNSVFGEWAVERTGVGCQFRSKREFTVLVNRPVFVCQGNGWRVVVNRHTNVGMPAHVCVCVCVCICNDSW